MTTEEIPKHDLDEILKELKTLEDAAAEATLHYNNSMQKIMGERKTKALDPRDTESGRRMIECIAKAKEFQKLHFGIMSDPGIIAPTTILIRHIIKQMKEDGELLCLQN